MMMIVNGVQKSALRQAAQPGQSIASSKNLYQVRRPSVLRSKLDRLCHCPSCRGRKAHAVEAYKRKGSDPAGRPSTKSSAASDLNVDIHPTEKMIMGQPVQKSMGYFSNAPDEPLKLQPNILEKELGPYEVDIKVTYNGLCHTDVHMKDNDWKISAYPFIPGHEVIGVVQAKGSEVKYLEVGDRVGWGWIKNSCRCCPACLRGEENICVKGYEGTIVMGNYGGFQQVARAPSDFVFKIPDGLESADAAPLLCAGMTVYAPLRRFLVPGCRVGILGIGGLGHLALQFAAAMGGVVTAFDISPAKAEESKGFGASEFVQFTDEQELEKRSGEFDLIVNCASAKVDTGKLLKLLKNNGTLTQIGIPGGAQMVLPLQEMVFGQKRVVGSIVAGRADTVDMFNLAAAKGIKPMVELMPMSSVNEAMERLLAGKAHYRIVLYSDYE